MDIDGEWWLQRSQTEQDWFAFGYIAASWTWAEATYQAFQSSNDQFPFREQMLFVYNALGPTAEQQAMSLANNVTLEYKREGTKHYKVYQIIHSIFTEWKSQDERLYGRGI